MTTDDKRVHLTYYYWGVVFLSMSVVGILTERSLVPNCYNLNRGDRIWPTTFITFDTDPVTYWISLIVYALFALSLFHRSLLFVGDNRERLVEKEGFDRRVVGLESPVHGFSVARVLTVSFFSILIIVAVYYIYIAF